MFPLFMFVKQAIIHLQQGGSRQLSQIGLLELGSSSRKTAQKPSQIAD
jgi:hypothetical protein